MTDVDDTQVGDLVAHFQLVGVGDHCCAICGGDRSEGDLAPAIAYSEVQPGVVASGLDASTPDVLLFGRGGIRSPPAPCDVARLGRRREQRIFYQNPRSQEGEEDGELRRAVRVPPLRQRNWRLVST
jgi:hypothetical protein